MLHKESYSKWLIQSVDGEQAYGKEIEFIIFAHKGRRPLQGGRPSTYQSFPRIDPTKSLHSCQKPVPLMSFLIEKSTKEGELVCDPFSGSGTTALAATGSKRRFIGWESDFKTFTIAQERLARDATQGKLF